MIPVIALVGRPNVGKSTLFNRITRSRDALVADYAGLTRDRKYGSADIEGKRCWVIDTGGISGEEQGIDSAMADQSRLAIEEADHIFLIIDAREGMLPADESLARYLRKHKTPVTLVANKCDGVDTDTVLGDFYRLGLGEPQAISASQGRGVKALLSETLQACEAENKKQQDVLESEREGAPEKESIVPINRMDSTRIAVIGRPNVGKSTLINRLLGEDRVVVYDQPGTTRDTVYIDFEREGKQYTFIDTAGIRRRKNISLTVEKFSIVKALQAIDDANVVVLLIDAQEGLVDQDMHLLGQVVEAGRALVVGVNKWDGLDDDKREWIKNEIDRRLSFVNYAKLHFISALHGSGVGNLYESINQAYRSAFEKFSTQRLTRLLEDAIQEHQPPMIGGRRIKLRYAHFGGNNPPRIIIHGNQVAKIPAHYTRYLEKVFRRELKLSGTPVLIHYRQGENPYANKRSGLTRLQRHKMETKDKTNSKSNRRREKPFRKGKKT